MLELQGISKTFNPGTVNEKRALHQITLNLADGDFATIIGSNGAGKSTMFNAITGAFLVDEGNIILDGKDITFAREHVRSKVIGHLFQDPLLGTAPHMTIEENMALAYLRAGKSKYAYFSRISGADKKKFREQLALLEMGLEDRMKQPVGLLSGGQRQALTLLMATMVTPNTRATTGSTPSSRLLTGRRSPSPMCLCGRRGRLFRTTRLRTSRREYANQSLYFVGRMS